jgi:hypothetical protein
MQHRKIVEKKIHKSADSQPSGNSTTFPRWYVIFNLVVATIYGWILVVLTPLLNFKSYNDIALMFVVALLLAFFVIIAICGIRRQQILNMTYALSTVLMFPALIVGSLYIFNILFNLMYPACGFNSGEAGCHHPYALIFLMALSWLAKPLGVIISTLAIVGGYVQLSSIKKI